MIDKSDAPKPTGFIIGAILEALLLAVFALFVGVDHAILFIGLCGLMFGAALIKTAITPSDPNAGPGVDPDHERIASINSLFPKAVIVSAIVVAVLSLGLGADTLHQFARDSLGFGPVMTEPLLRL